MNTDNRKIFRIVTGVTVAMLIVAAALSFLRSDGNGGLVVNDTISAGVGEIFLRSDGNGGFETPANLDQRISGDES